MKINHFYINSEEEVILKIAKEVLSLFKIEVRRDFSDVEETLYDTITVENETSEAAGRLAVKSEIVLNPGLPDAKAFHKECFARPSEPKPAAVRRLIKCNLYEALLEALGTDPAPWGILHGVRPTKIVHKYIACGLKKDEILARLQSDYWVQPDKVALLAGVAFRQRPFLAAAAPREVSVYIGIPFCLSRCLYCSFPSYVLPGDDVLQRFLAALKKDILAAGAVIKEKGLIVKHIYIGGGTPTSLPAREFSSFLDLAAQTFYQMGTAEFTVEAGRPDSVDDEKIQAMLGCHVSRVSVNPQTMQEKTLKHIGRNHTAGAIIELFNKFREKGMKFINMDLIIGLPGEGVAEVEDTLRRIAPLGPDDITLHALALKKGSALKQNRAQYPLPDDGEAAAMFAAAMRYMKEWGMEPYYLYRQGYMSGNLENIGFCRPGAEGLYNIQIMEENQTIIGIGPAAATKAVRRGGAMETSFHAKDLTTYLNDVDKYIYKRTCLLQRTIV